MVLLAEFNPVGALCAVIFLSMIAFVIWGLYYSAKQRGIDALSALCSTGGGILGIAAAVGLMFATGIGGALPGMFLGIGGGVLGAKCGQAFADSFKTKTKDKIDGNSHS